MWQVLKNELQNKINKPKTNSFQQLKKDFWNYPLPPNVRALISKKIIDSGPSIWKQKMFLYSKNTGWPEMQ